MGETNKLKWVGIRPVDPAEDIPVTWSGGKPFYGLKPAGSTQVLKDGQATNGTTTIYTVGATATLYICSAWIWCLSTAANPRDVALRIRDTVPNTVYNIFVLSFDQARRDGRAVGFPIPIEVPASYTIELYSSGLNATVYGGFTGYEQ